MICDSSLRVWLCRSLLYQTTRRRYAGADFPGSDAFGRRTGGDLNVSSIARQAGVDRSFLYRHRELIERLHRAQSGGTAANTTVSRASLHADLANAHEHNTRLQTRLRLLEKRLSELMGDQGWRDSSLGAPLDIETLQRTVADLEQHNAELIHQLDERDHDLAAARAASREFMIQLNSTG